MNEIINQYNKDYEKIIKTLNEVNLTTNYILKNILVRFSKHVADIGNLFIKFSEELNESINTNLKQYENSEIYIPQIDKKTNLRFNLEKFEEYDENNMENININQEQNNKSLLEELFHCQEISSEPAKLYQMHLHLKCQLFYMNRILVHIWFLSHQCRKIELNLFGFD